MEYFMLGFNASISTETFHPVCFFQCEKMWTDKTRWVISMEFNKSSFFVKELDVIVHKKIFSLYNHVKSWIFCTPPH